MKTNHKSSHCHYVKVKPKRDEIEDNYCSVYWLLFGVGKYNPDYPLELLSMQLKLS